MIKKNKYYDIELLGYKMWHQWTLETLFDTSFLLEV